jgi:hypothetical protein
MEKDIKLITRLCKEANIFPGEYYYNIINFIKENNSYVFFGRDSIRYHLDDGTDYQAKLLKLQFDILRALIKDDLLTEPDYIIVLKDTLTRYNLKGVFRTEHVDAWLNVIKASHKKEFVDYFFKEFEKKVGHISECVKIDIINGLPK